MNENLKAYKERNQALDDMRKEARQKLRDHLATLKGWVVLLAHDLIVEVGILTKIDGDSITISHLTAGKGSNTYFHHVMINDIHDIEVIADAECVERTLARIETETRKL